MLRFRRVWDSAVGSSNFTKFHHLLEFVRQIPLYGAPKTFNNDAFERNHGIVKKLWRKSNKRNVESTLMGKVRSLLIN
jgi:hypothetical protein